MTELERNSPAADWLEAELADTLDEDYELELSEPALSEEIADGSDVVVTGSLSADGAFVATVVALGA